MSAPDWTLRVGPVLNSRHWAVLSFVFVLLTNGAAIYLFDDVAKHTAFWSNVWVWYALVDVGLMFLLLAAMTVHLWQWRMEQVSAFGLLAGVCTLNLLLPSYIGIATYSAAPLGLKLLLWGCLLAYQGWFALGIVRAYRRVWNEPSLRKLLLVEKDDHFLFLHQGENIVRGKVGFQLHCSPLTMIVFMVIGFGTFFIRKPLTNYFDVNWVPIAYAIMSVPLATLATAMIVISIQYFIYPHRLTRETGKVVYLDKLSKPPGKEGNPC